MFSAASVCLFVRTITSERLNVGRSNWAVTYTVQKSRPSSKVKVKGQRSKIKVTRDKKKRKTAKSSPLTILSKAFAHCAVRCTQQQTIPLRRSRGGDRVTAVHADGGLRERSSEALRSPVLRRWENQRMLSSLSVCQFVCLFVNTITSQRLNVG